MLKKIEDNFNTLVAENYEKVAQDILLSHEHQFFPFEKIRRWWDRNEEIDLVGLNNKEKKILFGEVKWTKKPVGEDINRSLKRKAGFVDWNRQERGEFFCLFSKNGFTDNMLKLAHKEKVVLFHGNQLINKEGADLYICFLLEFLPFFTFPFNLDAPSDQYFLSLLSSFLSRTYNRLILLSQLMPESAPQELYQTRNREERVE